MVLTREEVNESFPEYQGMGIVVEYLGKGEIKKEFCLEATIYKEEREGWVATKGGDLLKEN